MPPARTRSLERAMLYRAPSPRPAGWIEGLWLGGCRNSCVKALVSTSMRQRTGEIFSVGQEQIASNLIALSSGILERRDILMFGIGAARPRFEHRCLPVGNSPNEECGSCRFHALLQRLIDQQISGWLLGGCHANQKRSLERNFLPPSHSNEDWPINEGAVRPDTAPAPQTSHASDAVR